MTYIVEESNRRQKASVVQMCIQHVHVDANLDGRSFEMYMSSSISAILDIRVNHSDRRGV